MNIKIHTANDVNNVLCDVKFDLTQFQFLDINVIGPIGAPIYLLEQIVRHSYGKSDLIVRLSWNLSQEASLYWPGTESGKRSVQISYSQFIRFVGL